MKYYIVLIFMFLSLGAMSQVQAQDLTDDALPDLLQGNWQITQAVGGPSLHDQDIFRLAQQQVGGTVRVDGAQVTLNDGVRCQLRGRTNLTLDNLDPANGNYKTNWGLLGLQNRDDDRHLYDVQQISITCPEAQSYFRRRAFLIGNNSQMVLLNFGDGYLRLQKISE